MTDLDQKPRPGEMSFRFIGKPLVRKEDARLITGRGRFSDDFSVDGQACAVMLRSPHAHARILGIDVRRATAMPRVLGVFTGAGCSADKASDVGVALVMVVAETVAQALDAEECVDVDYDVLPGVYHSQDAMQPGAPAVWDEVADNVGVETWFGGPAAPHEAFARTNQLVAMDFHIDRATGVPLEPRSALGEYDAGSGRYTLHAGSGGAVRAERGDGGVLGIAPERVG